MERKEERRLPSGVAGEAMSHPHCSGDGQEAAALAR